MKNQKLPQVKNIDKRIEGFSLQEIELLRQTYFKDLNDTEIKLALKQCKSMGLDPFNKEIYAYKYSGRMTLVTGIAGFRKIAHRQGNYLGCKVAVLRDTDNKIVSANAIVKKQVGQGVAEFEATVLFDEYDQKREKWKTMPEAMIRKVAEMNALKMAFPSIEVLSEENSPEPVYEDVEVIPDYESESQEVVEQTAPEALPEDPGEQMIKFKRGHKKIKEWSRQELVDFVAWAYKQERLAPIVQESLQNVEKYLKEQEMVDDNHQEAKEAQ